MNFALEINQQTSGCVSSILFQNSETTGTNDTICSRSREVDGRLLKLLRSYRTDSLKLKQGLKWCWDASFQPFVYPVNACQIDEFSQECCDFEKHRSMMNSLLNLEDNWDSYDAESPNNNSFTEAKKMLDYLQVIDFPPTKLVPSVEGGISFLFIRGKKYADIECDNDGDIICGLSDRSSEPILWQVGFDLNLFDTVEKIREFFRK